VAAYLVVEAVLTDPKKFKPYTEVVPQLITKFGGEYISIGGESEVLEGEWGATKVVLHRWPSMQAARDFWNSEEYTEAKKLREGTGTFRVMLVDGSSNKPAAKERLE